jgi:hypothetical protein
VESDEWRDGGEKQILRYAPFGYAQGRQDDTGLNGASGGAGGSDAGET